MIHLVFLQPAGLELPSHTGAGLYLMVGVRCMRLNVLLCSLKQCSKYSHLDNVHFRFQAWTISALPLSCIWQSGNHQPQSHSRWCWVPPPQYIEIVGASGCLVVIALSSQVSWVQFLVAANFFSFLSFHLITSKSFYFQHEARCQESRCSGRWWQKSDISKFHPRSTCLPSQILSN